MTPDISGFTARSLASFFISVYKWGRSEDIHGGAFFGRSVLRCCERSIFGVIVLFYLWESVMFFNREFEKMEKNTGDEVLKIFCEVVLIKFRSI